MKLFRKLKKKVKGEVDMTPIESKPHDFVSFQSISSKYSKKKEEIDELVEKQEEKDIEEESFSATPAQIKAFEEEFPGKHAVWRGNFTKGFKTWCAKNDNKD